MQKINENEINWINDGDDQDALTLNRPVKELLQKLGSTQSSDLVQQKGNSQDDVMSQKQVTDQLTGWGSQILPIQSGPDEMTNGLYRAQGLGFGTPVDGQDGTLLVIGSETVNPGQSTGETNQVVFGNGNINVRFSDKADDDGKPVWSDFRKLTYTDEQVLLTGNQTIQGKKTFNTLPESSAGQVPTNDNQLTNKRYVDSIVETEKPPLTIVTVNGSIIELDPGKKYQVSVYGVTAYRGNGNRTLQSIGLRDTNSSGQHIVRTPTRNINWHDGSQPHSMTFFITAPDSGKVYGYTDGGQAMMMTAIRLD